MKAIVLAAGYGKRLLPLTMNRPKHLLEIAGKPILKRILDKLHTEPIIDEIYIIVHYYAELIEQSIKMWYSSNTEYFNKCKVIIQSQPLGTGDAVNCALEHIDNIDSFMVIYGDLILGNSISEIINLYNNNKFDGYILGVPVNNPEMYGVLEVNNRILISLTEKPRNAVKGSLINGGLYILPSYAKKYFEVLQTTDRNEIELTDVISKLINSGSKITVLNQEKGWYDIGHPWQLLEANKYLLHIEKENFQIIGEIEKNVSIIGNVHLAKTARIRSGAYIEGPVYISEGSDIGPNCYIRGSSFLGKNVRVGNACEVKNSILYNGTHTAHLSYIGDSLIGEKCNLGAGTITANLRHDGKNVKVTVKNKRADSGRRKLGVIMGDMVKTGIGVNILPGVILSSGIWINAGEIVERDR